jgi:succinate dehydrogenase/fumarate reductase cytochrome b subunit
MHLYVLSNLKDPQKFKSIMTAMDNPLIKLSEIGLLFLVVAHAFNGFRLTLLDIGAPTRLHKPLFWLAAAICSLIVIAGSWPLVGGMH